MTEETDEVQSYGGKGVGRSEEQYNDFLVKPDATAEKQEEQDEHPGLLAAPREILKAVKADGAGHQAAQHDGQSQPSDGPVPVPDGPFVESVQRTGFMKGVHDGCYDAGRSGGGHADEIFRPSG